MSNRPSDLRYIEIEKEAAIEEISRGLAKTPKQLDCKWFYDERGSKLFDEICALDEYYITRTELGILENNIKDIAAEIGPKALLLEFGTGSGIKTQFLTGNLADVAGLVLVEISGNALEEACNDLRKQLPNLPIIGVVGDYTKSLHLPDDLPNHKHMLVFFPGSTIGNFTHELAADFLRKIRDVCGAEGLMLLGTDLVKDESILVAAYNDTQGVTSAFNLNALTRINRDFGANFQVENFRHQAYWNPTHNRIEMNLISEKDQEVTIGENSFSFAAGEHILTEYSHKFTLDKVDEIAQKAGWQRVQTWTDPQKWFGLHLLKVT